MAWDTEAAIEATKEFQQDLAALEQQQQEAIAEVRKLFDKHYKVAGLKALGRVMRGQSAEQACASWSKYAAE